jgi:hypothetical protein
VPAELHLAEMARENTIFGLPDAFKDLPATADLTDNRPINE